MSKSKKKQVRQSNNITDTAKKVSEETVKAEEAVEEAVAETAETVAEGAAIAEEAASETAEKAEEAVTGAETAAETVEKAEEVVNNSVETTVETVAETAAETVAEGTAIAEEAASETAEKAEEAVTGAETAAETAEKAEEVVNNSVETTVETAAETAAETVAEGTAIAEEAAEEETKEQPKKKKKPDVVSAVIRILVIAFFFIALGMLAKTLYGYLNDIETNKQLQQEFLEPEDPVISERPERDTPKYPGIMKPVATYPKIINREKMEQLKTLNNEFYMWFFIEGTDISYPVMYSGDNNKYLKKDFYVQPNVSGTLFLDFRNIEIGGNTIVYGHNMRNGTMFGELKKYNEELFFRKHTKIYTYLYDEKEVIEWTVFSAYPTNTKDRYITTAFGSQEDYFKFIKARQEKSLYTTDIVLKEYDDILTLSTCRDSATEGDDGRFVVHAVKTAAYPMT